ncbi:MAG: rod shape-determining protein RodA [Burkholderiales bacterium]|nr:rod shape-determining protein RodA [Burkholderiales bacterium]
MPPLTRRLFRMLSLHIDGFLLACATILILVGLAVLYSAADQNAAKVVSQIINITIACIVMWTIANIPPHQLLRFALPLYVAGLLLLIGVALFGEISNGARRWLNIGITRIQPSELMKIAVPLMLAWYFDRHEAMLSLKNYAFAALFLLVPVLLIARQPDLGTAILIASSGFFVILLAGLDWKILLGLFVSGLASLPVLWSVLHDYQKQRLLTLIDPSQDPLGAGYHTIQSMIAVGSGGIAGKGWLHGTQAHLDFLPEHTTDFIFAVFSEEFGLIGNFFLLIMYSLVIGRGISIAAEAPTLFSRLMAGSITLTFFTYCFVNMGMVSGILPVVGVPLPLISYGGTSMVTMLLGFGILMSIHTHKKLVKT